MTENEAISMLEQGDKNVYEADCTYEEYLEAIEMGRKALSEIQRYRTYKEIFENHFDEKVLKLFSNREEFGAWLERGKWIAKRCDEINKELEQYEAIGTIDEFKALKEKNEPKKAEVNEFDYGEGYVCGECESFLHYVDDDDEHIRTNYCCHCGTKIDWQ